MRNQARLAMLVAAALATGCGYTLQTSENTLAEKQGIRKIYVQALVNNTYKAGVENLVYNSLIKNLTAHRRITVVQDPELADAVLTGTVDQANYTASASAS